MSGRLGAMTRLAGLYARHTARRAVTRRREGEGLRAFDELYTPDRITALSAEERAGMHRHGDCIACGLCVVAVRGAVGLPCERLPLSLTRSIPDLWTARDLDLDAVDWEAAAAVCPTGVPLPAVADFVRSRLAHDGVEPPRPREPIDGTGRR